MQTIVSLRGAVWAGLLALVMTCGCAAGRPMMKAELEPLAFTEQAPAEQPASPPILTENYFSRDTAGSISEEALHKVLEAPVFLEEHARIGVVPVQGQYALDFDLPLTSAPAVLADALEGSGQFELATEIATDFPADRGLSGLRELAARYRSDYLLIYRHRFVDQSYLNPWAWGYVTGVGALFLPGSTLEVAGVLEATLFDVKTGTLLFTVQERVHDESRSNNWHQDLKVQWMKKQMLEQATQKLADQVLVKVRRLVAAREKLGGTARVISSAPLPEQVTPAIIPVTVAR